MKRVFDICLAGGALVVFGPLFIVSAILIKLTAPGPVFFTQRRVGKDGVEFTLLKLRSMTINESREIAQTTNADPDVFYVGKWLRRLKIDELPQIINVLRGDMSVVGPRPCLPQTRDTMPDWAKARFSVRPGLTGLAQINGNASITWDARWQYDITYVENRALLYDLKIIAKTVLVVVMGEEKFKGTP